MSVTVQYVSVTVPYVSVTVQYVSVTVQYVSVTVQYVIVTVQYVSVTVPYMAPLLAICPQTLFYILRPLFAFNPFNFFNFFIFSFVFICCSPFCVSCQLCRFSLRTCITALALPLCANLKAHCQLVETQLQCISVLSSKG